MQCLPVHTTTDLSIFSDTQLEICQLECDLIFAPNSNFRGEWNVPSSLQNILDDVLQMNPMFFMFPILIILLEFMMVIHLCGSQPPHLTNVKLLSVFIVSGHFTALHCSSLRAVRQIAGS